MKKIFVVFSIVLQSVLILAQQPSENWQKELDEQLALLGHRNWILVVDAAYPLQSKPAIKTIVTGESQLSVVKKVFAAIEKAPHVYPVVFLDKEIDFVPEKDAQGINNYKVQLYQLLQEKNITHELHEQLIGSIDEAAKVFNILVLKTNMTIPYTSVFFRLDCGYWNGEQEKMMREVMEQ